MPRSAGDQPWKPLVFKMPRKRPPREIKDDDDAFTISMRKRYDELQLVEEKGQDEARSVSETKIDDLILKEADDAKINARYALWRMDRENDRIRDEEENPSLEAMRRRFQQRADQLDGKAPIKAAPEKKAEATGSGFLNMARAQDIDELFESAQAAAAMQKARSAATASAPVAASAATAAAQAQEHAAAAPQEAQDEDWGQDYLEAVQKKSAMEDKFSRRVVKSPQDRRQDYEAEKGNMYLVTGGLGLLGSASSFAVFGINEAFGFFVGSIGAVLYLSGLADYADNAESPIGTALGGRRLLVPVIVILLVIQWYKLENLFPLVASWHLDPSLPATVLGLFTFVFGQVAAGFMKSVPAKAEDSSAAGAR